MDFKHKEINKQKEINAGAPQEQAEIKQYSLEEFLEDDYAQLEQKEQNLQGDMAAGEALVQKKDILKDFEVIELPKEVKAKSLDETFEDAYKAAHIFEKKTSKMKKSTLKKRRAEYAQKTTEQKTMLDVKQKVNALKSGPTRDAIQKELTSFARKKKLDSNTLSDSYLSKQMDQLMYFQEKDELTIDDMAVAYADMNLDLRNCTADKVKNLSEEEKGALSDRFTGKMAQYEKLLHEALSWKVEDFAFKDNHSMAKDPDLANKMKKLNLVPAIKAALEDYQMAMDSGMMESLRKRNGSLENVKSIVPPELLKELESKVDFFERAQEEYEARIDLMSNKYYALLGKSDTANLDVIKLKNLGHRESNMQADVELVAYYDAIRRNRIISGTPRSLKGKKPDQILDRIKKERGQKTDKASKKAIGDMFKDWTLQAQGGFKDDIKKRVQFNVSKGSLGVLSFDFKDNDLITHEVKAVNKSIGAELDDKQLNKLVKAFPKRLKASKNATTLVKNGNGRLKSISEKFNKRLLAEFTEGFNRDVREEREGLAGYFMDPRFAKMSEDDQYKIVKTVMLPFTRKYDTMTEAEKKAALEASDNQILKLFKDALEGDRQEKILSKYKNAEDFVKNCPQEDYDYILGLRHIGGWCNQFLFENRRKDQASLVQKVTKDEHKKLFIQLKSAAYGFDNGMLQEINRMTNKNFAFLDDATIDKIAEMRERYRRSSEKEKENNIALKAVGGKKITKSLEDIFTTRRHALQYKGKVRIGENVKKMMEQDEADYIARFGDSEENKEKDKKDKAEAK